MQQNEFQHIPATFWVYALLPFVVIAITLVGIKTHNPFLFGFIGVVPFAFLLMNRIDLWLVTIFAIYNSSLRIPGVLGQLELVHVMIAGLIGVMFLRWIIVKQGFSRADWMWRCIYLFGAVLLFTIAVRGAGFRFLGDIKWGGMRYVELLLTLAFPFVVTNLRLKPAQWRSAMIAMSVLALIPLAADVLFIVTRGAVYYQYYLIQHGAVQDAFQTFGTETMTRFESGGATGWAVMLLPFFLFPADRRNWLRFIPFILVGLGLASISGHRLAMLSSVGFLWLYGFYMARGKRMAFVVASAALGFLFMCLCILFSPYLPFAVQRSLSFIPFMELDFQVAHSASGTLDWRWKVWHNAILYEVPLYWLVGKGYAYDPTLLASQTMNSSPVDWARITVAYHSGPLSLLIGMGIVGLIAGLGVLLFAWRRHYRFATGTWFDPRLRQFHTVFFVMFSLYAFRFIFVYGDVQKSFPGFFKVIALMEGLALANSMLRERAEANADGVAGDVPGRKVLGIRAMPAGL